MKRYRTQVLFCTVNTTDGKQEIWEGDDGSEIFSVLWDARTRKHEWSMPAELEDGRIINYQMCNVVSFEFEPVADAAATGKT